MILYTPDFIKGTIIAIQEYNWQYSMVDLKEHTLSSIFVQLYVVVTFCVCGSTSELL